MLLAQYDDMVDALATAPKREAECARHGGWRPGHPVTFVMSAINRALALSRDLYCPHLREL